jgi:hypothetical protein
MERSTMGASNLASMLEQIETREDLARFIAALKDDFVANRDEWENWDLGAYLESMAAWMTDMDRYRRHVGQPFSSEPSWKAFAEILYAGKIYE